MSFASLVDTKSLLALLKDTLPPPVLAILRSGRLWVTVFVVAFGIITWIAAQYLRRAHRRLRRHTDIAGAFLSELTAGHSKGHDKKLFFMLHPQLVATAERGLIRGMARCLVHECGAFVAFDEASLEVKEGRLKAGEIITTLTGKANFAKARGVSVMCSWLLPKPGEGDGGGGENAASATQRRAIAPRFINFAVESPDGPPGYDAIKFVDPEDLQQFGEDFIVSLFKKQPTHALSVMCDSLRSKYVDEAALAKELVRVISSAGGLKTRSTTDIALVKGEIAFKTVKGPDGAEHSRGHAVELEYRIAGARLDLKATLRLVFVNKRVQVVRYMMQTLKSEQQNVIVDQETGEKIIV